MSELARTGDRWLDSYDGPRPLRGKPRTAQRGGRCAICGGPIAPGEGYVWSEEHRRGAHWGCGTVEERKHG